MTDASAQFPQSEDGDPDDVSLALETGNALWRKGDHREALRWLRKATEAASEAGADMRSVALASVMADLTAAQNVTPTASLSPPIPATERASARPPAQSVAPQRARPSPRSVAPTPPSAKNSGDSAEPAVELKQRKRRPTSPSSLIARAPNEPVAPTIRSTEPRPQSMVASLVAAADRAQAGDDLPSQPAQRAATENLGGAASPEARSAAGPQLQPAAASSPSSATSGNRQAFRVAVEPSDDRSFVVRVLGEGEAAPGYAYEALLVPLEAGVQLLRGKK